MLARIKPYDLQRGHVTRSVTFIRLNGASFEAGRWYDLAALAASIRIPEDQIVEVLEALHQDSVNHVGPKVFDVVTPEEAQAIAEEELRVTVRAIPAPVAPEVPKIDLPEQQPAATPMPRPGQRPQRPQRSNGGG